MFGCKNLGDEAMLTAAKSAFGRLRVVGTVGRTRLAGLNDILDARRPDVIVVGGGTLIHGGEDGRNSWLEFVEKQIQKGAAVATFGTGVNNRRASLQKEWGG